LSTSEKDKQAMEYIETKDMPLEEWLALLWQPPGNVVFKRNSFPTDRHKENYLATVHDRSDKEIVFLLEQFLWVATTFPLDALDPKQQSAEEHIKNWDDNIPVPQHLQRLLMWRDSNGRIPVRDGICWVLDLLPHHPWVCIQGIRAYFRANIATLPDVAIYALEDAIDVITSRYIEAPMSGEEFAGIGPRDMEILVARLYQEMRYEVDLTPARKDGGRDVIVSSLEGGRRERALIDVKHYAKPVGVIWVRHLLGVVSHERASRGILVTTSRFTSGARKLAGESDRMELIDGEGLVRMLRRHFGPYWWREYITLIEGMLSSRG